MEIAIARGLSSDQACDVGAMTYGNIASTDWKNNYIVFIAKELKIRKSDITLQGLHFVIIASLCQGTESHSNGCVAFKRLFVSVS